jgi:hypothetical protein
MERGEEAGQGQEEERGGRAREPPRALELGERLLAVVTERTAVSTGTPR